MESIIRTLPSYLRTLAGASPKKMLLGDSAGWLNASQASERVDAIAHFLVQSGICCGDFVALRTYRNVKAALVLLALQAIGAVAVLIDPRQNISELLSKNDPPISVSNIIDPNTLDVPSVISCPFPAQQIDPQTPGFIIFTSGSTGVPKAVMLSQHNLIANLIDSKPLGGYSEDDIALGALPLDHVFGLVLLAGVAVLGYGIYFPKKTDVPSLLQTIESQKITRMNGVPSLYLTMAAQAESYDISSLRCGFVGGAPCTQAQICHIEEKLSMTLIPVYGMSECIGISCADYQQPRSLRAAGVGSVYSMTECRICHEDGTEAAVGEIGEIYVRGPARMIGYYPNLLPPEHYYQTGDLGYLDQKGILHLTGRKKDIIIRNGNNLSVRKIEDALLSINVVSDAAVVGIPDDICGEVPVGMIVCPDNSLRSIWIQLHALLQKNEIPKELFRVQALPKTAVGKPDKQRIREVLMKWKV